VELPDDEESFEDESDDVDDEPDDDPESDEPDEPDEPDDEVDEESFVLDSFVLDEPAAAESLVRLSVR
jgi:hypothetical protein